MVSFVVIFLSECSEGLPMFGELNIVISLLLISEIRKASRSLNKGKK